MLTDEQIVAILDNIVLYLKDGVWRKGYIMEYTTGNYGDDVIYAELKDVERARG